MPRASHRDQLLRGAIECLETKGYARTTARDIAAAADANLASIGYHFGSKEALLNEALIQTFEAWTRRIGEISFAAPDASPLERVGASWVAMLDSFEEQRPVLIAFLESMAQATRSQELREQLAEHYRDIRRTVADMISASLGPAAEERGVDPQVVSAFLIAVCDGFVMQWVLDPEQTPTGAELVSALGSALAVAVEGGARSEA
jgi:AcrR family transcriptional regulator